MEGLGDGMEGERGAVYFRLVHDMGASMRWLGAIVYRLDQKGDRSCLGVRKLVESLELRSSTPNARKGRGCACFMAHVIGVG